MGNDNIYFEYVMENSAKVIVSNDDEKLDDPRDIMRAGQIVWFPEMAEDTRSYEEEAYKDLLHNDEFIIVPLYFTEKGIYTKEKFLSSFAGYYSISKNEVKQVFDVTHIDDEAIDELMIYIYDEISLFEKYVTDDVYQYIVFDDDGSVIDQCGSFYDLESCVEEGKRVLTEYKSGINLN